MPPSSADIAELLSLMVHDLRNPAATIGANLSFVKECDPVAPEDTDDVSEALADADHALLELMRGLEHLSWIARWLANEAPVSISDGDVVAAVRHAASRVGGLDVDVRAPDGPLMARGGTASSRLVEVLLANSLQHAPRKAATIIISASAGAVIIEIHDDGRAVANELREIVFTADGQHSIKGRSDGRYGRFAGLLAARLVAEAIGCRLETDGEDGAAVFRIVLEPADKSLR